MSVSLWRCSPSPERIEADVCIVGAGICGLSCALEVEGRGLRAVVVERAEVAAGASGRSAGFLMRGMAESYAVAAGALGRDAARQVWRWSEENLDLLKTDGAAGLASFRPTPSCLLALNEADAADLERSAAMLAEDGFEARCPWQGDDTIFACGRVHSALLNPHDASVNPVELCRHLAGRIRGRIVEGQPVFAIEPGQPALVRGPDVEIRAERVIVATNAFAPGLLPALAGFVTPQRAQMLAARAPGCRLDACYYANRGADYLRATPEGLVAIGGQRARFAGAEQTSDDSPTAAVQQSIEALGRELLGRGLDVVARWAGIMGFSPDGLPLIGPVEAGGAPAAASPVWFCGGFTGHGMSLARRSARETVDAMLEGRPPAFPLDRVRRAGAAAADPLC